MRLSAAVLGAGAVKQLEETAADAVLVIGSDRLTRAELAAVGCFNFHAARLLSKVLHAELRVRNLRQVFEKIAPVDLALPHVGVISLAVLGAAFEAKGIGGDARAAAVAIPHARRVGSARAHQEAGRRLRAHRQAIRAVSIEFRVAPHSQRPGAQVVELWRDGVFIGQVTADDRRVSVLSKHPLTLATSDGDALGVILPGVHIVCITIGEP